jgi:nucleoside-triphosphatase THEP1
LAYVSTPRSRPMSRSHFDSHLETAGSRDRLGPEIVLVTGESGVGKTTYCTQIIAYARKLGLSVAGLLTLPRSCKEGKIALDVEDIRTGQRRPLAEGVGSAEGPATGKWQFHHEGLGWGAEILRRATPCDVLLIDELGPLELTRDLGWTAALDVLRAGKYRMAAVVVRPALLDAFQKRIGNLSWRTLALTESNRHDLHQEIKAILGGDP